MDTFDKESEERRGGAITAAKNMIGVAIVGAIIWLSIILSAIIGLLWLIKQWFF